MNDLREELDKLNYSKDVKELGIANMPNYYIIPKVELHRLLHRQSIKAQKSVTGLTEELIGALSVHSPTLAEQYKTRLDRIKKELESSNE